jgi:hypothetical protein
MFARLTCALAVLVLLLGTAAPAAAQAPQELVERFLADHDARGYTITAIDDDFVLRTFPSESVALFGVRFRQYPVAFLVPEGFSASNVVAVIGGQVLLFTNAADLETFFLTALPPVQNENQASDAGRTWVRLREELVQDGFYAFDDPSAFVLPLGDFTIVFAQTAVRAGGRGSIRALLIFDANGVLVELLEAVRVVPGPRPICQATKLLDPDPIVRKMAEQCLLYMGTSAKEYLDEQRAKASPELKEAIDRLWKRILEQEK